MSELNVTPGEWRASVVVQGGDTRSVVLAQTDRDYFVATIEKGALGDTMMTEVGNAHLIAASKELYEALVEFHGQYHCVCGHPYCKDCDRTKQAEAALAKARGEAGSGEPKTKENENE